MPSSNGHARPFGRNIVQLMDREEVAKAPVGADRHLSTIEQTSTASAIQSDGVGHAELFHGLANLRKDDWQKL